MLQAMVIWRKFLPVRLITTSKEWHFQFKGLLSKLKIPPKLLPQKCLDCSSTSPCIHQYPLCGLKFEKTNWRVTPPPPPPIDKHIFCACVQSDRKVLKEITRAKLFNRRGCWRHATGWMMEPQGTKGGGFVDEILEPNTFCRLLFFFPWRRGFSEAHLCQQWLLQWICCCRVERPVMKWNRRPKKIS